MEKAKVYKIESDCLQGGVIRREEDPMRGKISKAMVALIAAAFVLCFVSSCDLEGSTQFYTVPTWLRGEYLTDTAESTREEAADGQRYFVGVRATSNNVSLLYRVKGTGTDSKTDRLVEYRQERVPAMINPSYTASFPVEQDPGVFTISAYVGSGAYPPATLRIERVTDWFTGETVAIEFKFKPEGLGGYRILP